MKFLRVTINDSVPVNCNIAAMDSYRNEVVFLSVFGYANVIKQFSKQMNKRSKVYVQGYGTYDVPAKAYDVYKYKDQESDYTHAVFVRKDIYNFVPDTGRESLTAYVFAKLPREFNIYEARFNAIDIKLPKELLDRVYAKLYKYLPVPLVEDWMNYIVIELVKQYHLTEISMFRPDEMDMKLYRLNVTADDLFDIVSTGLKNGNISINGTTEPSQTMVDVSGLDSYLNSFSTILAERIQQSFKPKFDPKKDEYSQALKDIDDYMSFKGLTMFESQKAVAEAVSRNLDKNNVSIICGEMGAGKTAMSIAAIFANHKDWNKPMTNVIMCPSHLVEKWKNELERLAPLSEAIIVDDFSHFKKLEKEINNPKRRKHLFLILSKETAKFGYEKRPAVVWSEVNQCYVCPSCGQKLFRYEYEGKGRDRRKFREYLREKDFMKEYSYNQICINNKKVWDSEAKKWIEVPCNTPLWAPVLKEDKSNWIKLSGGNGWIEARHLDKIFEELSSKDKLTRKETQLLLAVNDAMEAINSEEEIANRAPRKYPLSRYIRKYFKHKIDYFIGDEVHLYKGGNSIQGQAFGDLVQAAKKTIALTGTLLNGYASGLYYILYRLFPHQMKKHGFDYSDEGQFSREYGVIKRTSEFTVYNGREDRRLRSNEKILPGVSPLVFTEFLLENTAFITLADISEGLPSYTEIPVPIQMDATLESAYQLFERELRNNSGFNRRGGFKIMSQMLQALSVYPDMPYNQPPIIDVETGDVIVTPPELDARARNKEEAFLEIVKDKVEKGEKVLVYYYWTNKTDVDERLSRLLTDEGIKCAVLRSGSVSSKDRESWIRKKLDEGIDVLICNPSLVETGLDLLDFTTIIFYQIGYNLYTLRQAARRSWRLSQDRDIEVYFLYYRNTIQEQALSLMATKLQAAQAIEGRFSEEGLHALSNNEDLLTQIANSVFQGIKHTVDVDVFGSHKRDADSMLLENEAEKKKSRKKEKAPLYIPLDGVSYPSLYELSRNKKKQQASFTEKYMQNLFAKKDHIANLLKVQA